MTVKQEGAGEDRLRAFIAVELPETIIVKLKDLQQDLRSRGLRLRWTRPENIHLTLKFLGDINRAEIQAVEEALGRSVMGFKPMKLSVKGIGVFPGAKHPRVLWAGISGQVDELRRLQADLDRSLTEIGFLAEKRSFTGHLTLGRFKGGHDPERIIQVMASFNGMESDTFTADSAHLYQSRLFSSGPVYTKLFTAVLAG